MIVLLENDYVTLYRHDDIKAYEQRFKPESVELFGKSYINQMKIFGEEIEKSQRESRDYPNLIINTTNGGPTMEPEVQEWMHSHFYPILSANNITTKAYCLGQEIISKLSVELTAEDDPNALFRFKFFATLEEGIDWITEQNI